MTDDDAIDAMARAIHASDSINSPNYSEHLYEPLAKAALAADPLRKRLGPEAVEAILRYDVHSIHFKNVMGKK